jgi:hypothetical protein
MRSSPWWSLPLGTLGCDRGGMSESCESLPESGPEVRPASARVIPLPADLAVLAAECAAVARGGSPRVRDRPPSMGVG